MKAPVKLSLAIALALASGSAFALGLGAIQVKSGLNQPLDAEIPVITESAAEVNALTVDLASNEDFERIGLSKSRLSVAIDMTVATNAKGQTVIKLSTKDPVREPLLDFLLVANWSKGKLLREYTVLLDPPVTAPAKSTATVAPVAEKPVAAAQPLAEPKPAPPPKAARPEPKPPVAAAAAKPAKPAPAPAAPPAPKPAAQPAATGGDYGPVAQGETLSEIARATRPDEKTSVDQMMLALLKTNPKAFYQDNINALKRGAILRIPSGEDLKASGTMREAAEQVHNQNAAWTGKTPVAAPTLVAHTGTSTKDAAPAAKSGESKPAKQERLALVPPGAGKSDSTTDRAGAAGGTGKESAEVKAELARTKEALASREQEAGELKSRVKQLEDISSKDQRLISMKDSEIADLQKKLKDLQAKAAAPPAPAATTAAAAAKPAETPAKPAEAAGAKPDQKITAKDIWGDMNGADKGAAKPAAAGATPAAPAAATPAPTPAASASTTPTAPAASESTPAASATTAAASAASTPAPAPADAGSASTSAPASTPAAGTAEAVKPAASSTAPAKSTAAAKVTPLEPASEPFYKNQSVLLGGGAALLLVGLMALMRFMRKPKPSFAGVGEAELADAGADEDELRLRDALQQNPANTAASLELLRHYYARGDATKFEAAAETMHAHLSDPHAPEWDEVLAMGSVLAPHHPLFSAIAAEPILAHDEPARPAPEFEYPEHDGAPAAAADAHTHIGTFDFEPAAVEPVHVEHVTATPHVAPAHDDSFDFDLPMRGEEDAPAAPAPAPAHYEPEPTFEPAPVAVAERQDDIYVGEDAIGTKLDLAKAYLDMGDPEGAKSMLDEVMAEGNDTQRDEARKLLAEIR